HAHATLMIREVVILSARYGVRQLREPELGEAGQELVQMLAAEGAKDELGRVGAAPPAHRGQDEPGKIGMIEDLHRPVSSRDRLVHGDILLHREFRAQCEFRLCHRWPLRYAVPLPSRSGG